MPYDCQRGGQIDSQLLALQSAGALAGRSLLIAGKFSVARAEEAHQMSSDQREFDATDASDLSVRSSRTWTRRSEPEEILRWTLYLHVLAILVCVGMILQESKDRHSNASRPRAGGPGELIIIPALLGLVACPFATLLICGVYSERLTRRAKRTALATMVVLIWFQVVWIIGPLVGNADGAKEIRGEIELRNKLLETTRSPETE
jgi:hypothetical protein